MSNASADNSTFNWDAFESENFYDADRAAIEESYSQTLSRVNENEVVEGVVVAKDKREVIVNIGYKSEGVINISEFRYNPNLQVGDKVEVFVENAEDKGDSLFYPTKGHAPSVHGIRSTKHMIRKKLSKAREMSH